MGRDLDRDARGVMHEAELVMRSRGCTQLDALSKTCVAACSRCRWNRMLINYPRDSYYTAVPI